MRFNYQNSLLFYFFRNLHRAVFSSQCAHHFDFNASGANARLLSARDDDSIPRLTRQIALAFD